MKFQICAAAVALSTIFPIMTMSGERIYQYEETNKTIRIYPETGIMDTLNQITVTTEHPTGFGAFVYMPSLYSINKDGSIGTEVSPCELMDDSARGKDTLHFRVINPPKRSGRYAFIIKDNSFSLNSVEPTDDPDISSWSEKPIPIPRSMPQTRDGNFRNFPVNLESDTLRILHISNSYGGNLLEYVNDILESSEVDVSKVLIERLVYSGGSFSNWVDVNYDKNSDMYWYFKVAGNLNTTMSGWEGEKKDGAKFRKLLEENKWDLIVLNQASQYATNYEKWNSNSSGGKLPELLNIIRKYQPNVPVGFLLIHSWAENYKGNTQHWTSTQRWEKIRDGAMWLKNFYDIDFIIPYGTAIQNLRLTEYNNPSELTKDGTHLSNGLPQYTAGCCYFETIFSSRYKKSIWSNPLRLHHMDNNEDGMIQIDDVSAEIAQKAAFLATHNMFEIRNPYLTDLRDYHYGDNFNKMEYRTLYELKGTDSNQEQISGVQFCIYGPTGILIGKSMTEDDWTQLPEGLYIRNGEKIYKSCR